MNMLSCPCTIRTTVIIAKTIVDIIKIAVPILLIVLGMTDIFKATISKDESEMKKATKKLTERIAAAAIVFFVIIIINFVIGIVGNNDINESWASCWDSPGDINECSSKDDNIIEKPNVTPDNDDDDTEINTCSLNFYITPRECFSGTKLSEELDFEEYLIGVLYGEEDPGLNGNEEYMKAFVIVARTYTINRAYTINNVNYVIKSCDSNQNWCDPHKGCYRYQTQKMFDACITNSLARANNGIPYYTAQQCADRVTTAPGRGESLTTFFTVNNSNWPSSLANSSTSSKSTTRWKGQLSTEEYEKLKKAVYDTEGLVIKKADGSLLNIGYTDCKKLTNGNHLCPSGADELADQGYTYKEIIAAFTTDYPDITIECYSD